MRVRMVVSGWLLILLLGSHAEAAEVSLGRSVTRQRSPSSRKGLDSEAVARLCGDEDGCKMVVSLEGPYEAASLTTRLFVDAGLNRWYVARGASGQYSWDANVTVNNVLSLGSGAYTCLVDDGDYYNPGFDFFAGFEVTVSGPGTEATCTVTIID